ncbi:4-hydroxy-tetrahydrodipicolinate reductase, partial [Patescibacteria group bacterium]|nr:4-hydroxy-tetrahydrodipicolinate reductase [Patescibacteria group bacterium]
MKIALIGFGNMGREVDRIVKEEKKHQIVSVSFGKREDGLDAKGIKKADVAIDFTAPDVILSSISAVSKIGTNLVIGTTGWYDQLEKVKKIAAKYKTGIIYGSNFSIGANVFFQIVRAASERFAKFPQYDVYGIETHHIGKKDSPSGTAKTLGRIILADSKTKKVFQNERVNRQIRPEELHFSSVRGGANPGRHEIVFDSAADEIRLIHQAHGRQGFAQGAIMAAEYIKDKKGLYRFEELF